MKGSLSAASLTPLVVAAGFVLATGTPAVCAQEAAAPYTMHVYTGLVEVPALVLNEDLKSVASVKREQFAIRLDHGPVFQPTHMRVEGDDPVSLAILLDARGDQDDILKEFGKALATLAPKYLHPTDHISIYAIDCALAGTGDEIPADAATLKSSVAAALAYPSLHGAQHRGACGSSIRLWDAIVKVTGTLGDHPGRRVLLVVSKGGDGKSSSGFAETVHAAESKSVAIFGLRYWEQIDYTPIKFSGNTLTYHNGPIQVGTLTASSGGDPDFLDEMCDSTGGFAFNLWNPELINKLIPAVAPALQSLVTMLRGRYILEFPRPDAYKTGLHNIDVSVPRTHDFVSTTGVTYYNPNPALMADPTTIHSNPSPAEYGKRHPLEARH